MRLRFPELTFLTMDARKLDFVDASYGAVVDKGHVSRLTSTRSIGSGRMDRYSNVHAKMTSSTISKTWNFNKLPNCQAFRIASEVSLLGGSIFRTCFFFCFVALYKAVEQC